MKSEDRMCKKVALFAGLMLVALAACLIAGCTACRSCRADEVRPSPQATSKWRPAAIPLPTPPVPPVVPRQDFASPPTDGPDPATPPAPTVPPAPVVPPAPAPPAPSGTAEMTTSSKASGAINILGNTGSIVLGNTGAVPAPSAAPQQAPQQIPIGVITAVATNPEVQSIALKAVKQLGGGLYYALTGKCPSAPAATPAAYLAVPQQSYAMVPVQVQAAPQPVAYQVAAPQPVQYVQAPAATPQYFTAAPTPAAPKKCRFFGGN